MIGLGASIIGLFSGLALALGLNALFKSLNLDLPQTDTVFATRTIVVSLLVGTLVTLVAGLFPIRATRVPPIAAVREGATLPARTLRPLHPVHRADRRARRLRARLRTLAGDIAVGDRFALLGVGVLALSSASRCSPRGSSARSRRPSASRPGAWAAPPASWRRERAAQPGTHRRDRGRTDDRDRARDVHLRARQRPARLEQRRDRAADPGRPDRHLAGRLLEFPAAVGTPPRPPPASRSVEQRPPGHRRDRRDGANLTGLDDRVTEVYDFRWRRALTRCSHSSAATALVLQATSPRTRISRSAPSRCARPQRDEVLRRRGILRGQPVLPALGTASISQAAFDDLYERPRNRFTLLNTATAPEAAKPGVECARGASRTRGSRRARSGSTRRIRRSSSSCSCSTSCSPSP